MKLSLYKLRLGVIGLSLVLLSGWVSFTWGQKSAPVIYRSIGDQADMSLFWQVWDKLNEAYLIKEALKPQEMVYGAIRGMTAALGDPYTVFLEPSANKESKEELDGVFEGV